MGVRMHKDRIEKSFLSLWEEAWDRTDLGEVLQQCTEQESACMKYLYAGMPYSDMADYHAELFLKFVRHAFMVRDCTPWGKKMDMVTFLNYVMQYRVNNEHIEFYSDIFFQEIYPRIQNLSMYEAAIEVNFWAYEQATYHSTDDRTGSPFTVIKNAYGRCGEESTLVTAALRSVGIPARQVYAPRWSHCDDNHAWVEVWIDGTWHFLGACEPEVKLDRGWFVLAASRAPIVHTRAFSKTIVDEANTTLIPEEKRNTRINVLSRYADIKNIHVTVFDLEGAPKEGVTVLFEVVNYSELYAVAALKTGQDGTVDFTTSKGSIVVSAFDPSGYGWTIVNVKDQDEAVIRLSSEQNASESCLIKVEKESRFGACSFTFIPAVGGEKPEVPLSKEEETLQRIRLMQSEQIRHQKENTFCSEEMAEQYANTYIEKYGVYMEQELSQKNNSNSIRDELTTCRTEVASAIYNSRGNEAEIRAFLEDSDTKEQSFYKCKLLSSIRKKDLTDTSCEYLRDHLNEALQWKERYPDEIFISYVLCPRILDERILPYRLEIQNLFSEEQIKVIQHNPKQIGEWIQTHIKSYKEDSYAALYTSPVGAIRFGMASEQSIQILAVAMLRSLGIAAKIEMSSGKAVYLDKTIWRSIWDDERQKGTLYLINKSGENLQYFTNFTIARYVDNHYKTLNLSETIWKDGRGSYQLEEGNYRVITTERQLGGICQVKFFFVKVQKNCVTEMVIDCLKELAVYKSIALKNIVWERKDGEKTSLKQCLGQKEGIAAWIEVGKEPTEHLLNEIMEAKEKYQKVQAFLIVPSEEAFLDATLTQALREVPTLQVLIQRSAPDIAIYKQFELPKKALPLVVVIDKKGNAVNACAGYNVGTGELVLNALKGENYETKKRCNDAGYCGPVKY